jgi:pimeloyl-ACP methyl ester carboxylesterase
MDAAQKSSIRTIASFAIWIALLGGAQAKEMTKVKVASGKATLAVVTAGSGRPLVFLHAGVADWRMWRAQMETFSKTHLTITYDRRGYGETTYEAEDHDPRADLAAVLDTTSKDEAVVLIGCSMGGALAVDFALTYPQRVKALVLVGTAISGAPQIPLASYSTNAKRIFAEGEVAEKAGDLDRVNALEAQAWLDGPEAPEGRVTDPARALFLEMNGRALRAAPAGRTIGEVKAYDRLAELKVPILFIIGTHDFPDINETSTHLSTVAPDAKLVRLETAHLPSLEQPDAFSAALQEFLSAKKL